MSRDFFGDLVAFQDVLERLNLDAEFIRHIQQHDDLVSAVAVRMHQQFAAQNVGHRVELEIAARRERIFTAFFGGFVSVPLLHIIAPLREGIADRLFDAHACGREAGGCAGRGRIA